MKICVINGPNLNMLGIREPNIYGSGTYNELVELIKKHCEGKGIEVSFCQSNHEGVLVDRIQEEFFKGTDGIVINPGAYTHTSIALLDAVKATSLKTVEVHISKVDEREAFRQTSYIRSACVASIIGEGFNGYLHAIDILFDECRSRN